MDWYKVQSKERLTKDWMGDTREFPGYDFCLCKSGKVGVSTESICKACSYAMEMNSWHGCVTANEEKAYQEYAMEKLGEVFGWSDVVYFSNEEEAVNAIEDVVAYAEKIAREASVVRLEKEIAKCEKNLSSPNGKIADKAKTRLEKYTADLAGYKETQK